MRLAEIEKFEFPNAVTRGATGLDVYKPTVNALVTLLS